MGARHHSTMEHSPLMPAKDLIHALRASFGDSFDFDGSFFCSDARPTTPTPRFYRAGGDATSPRYAARLSTGARGWFMRCGHDATNFSVVVIFGVDDMFRVFIQPHGDEDAGRGLPSPWSVARLSLSQEERADLARRVRGARTETAIVGALATVVAGARRPLLRGFTFQS